MIIGIGHKKQVGKDTVGKIIQIFLSKDEEDIKFLRENPTSTLSLDENSINNWDPNYNNLSPFSIQKFADPLKDMTCIALGCTREDLEKEEFKNTELGEEWDRYEVFNPTMGEGTFYKLANSKEEAQKYIDIFGDPVPGFVKMEYRVVKMTPRLFMELLGTSCGREIIHPQMWVNALMSKYTISELAKAKIRRKTPFASYGYYLPKWIVTDVRFPEEAKSIKDRGGILIKVNRPDAEIRNTKPENALNNYTEWDYEIDNSLDLSYLVDKVREILIKEKLI